MATDISSWLASLVVGPVAGVLGALMGSFAFRRTPLAERLSLAIGTVLSVVLSQFDTRLLAGHTQVGGMPVSKALDPFVLALVSAVTIGATLVLFGRESLRPGKGQSSIVADSNVFISYRRSDSLDITGRLYEHLTRELPGLSIFRDLESIPLGIDFRHHVNATLATCRVCLVVIGPNWLTVTGQTVTGQLQRRLDEPDDQVRQEVELAKLHDLVVIPVLVSGAALPQAAELPPSIRFLAYRNAAVLRPDPDFRRDAGRLIENIRQCI